MADRNSKLVTNSDVKFISTLIEKEDKRLLFLMSHLQILKVILVKQNQVNMLKDLKPVKVILQWN